MLRRGEVAGPTGQRWLDVLEKISGAEPTLGALVGRTDADETVCIATQYDKETAMYGWFKRFTDSVADHGGSLNDPVPTVNVDSIPMHGNEDLYGACNGATSLHTLLFESGPSVNIDGTPMVGCVDIHGNPFGITSDDTLGCASLDNGAFSSESFDSWSSGSSDGGSSSDSFGSNDW